MEKVTVVVTVLNEEKTILRLLSALVQQTQIPDEIVVVDGGSKDQTQQLLQLFKPSCKFMWFERKGNRSVGRNAAIHASTSHIIAVTDAGCIPEKHWLQRIVTPIVRGKADVVAGYYRFFVRTAFEKAASAYMLVMPEHVNELDFLPATRSMAFTKSAWKKVGEFPELLSNNEDYVFAHLLKKAEMRMEFVKNAVVTWSPPISWSTFLKQIWRFAYGDCEAGILRPKVVFIFLRWMFFAVSAFLYVPIFFCLFFMYCIWSVAKNGRHLKSIDMFWILPAMQISTDLTVMIGSIQGLLTYAKKTH